MTQSLYILDGHAQIYRAFYAPSPELTSPAGEPTKATYVFCQMLVSLIRDKKPTHLAMAMDVSDETVFRKDIHPDYKANRDPAPEALHVQADRIVSIVEAIGIPILRVPGFEADDVMATVVRQLRDRDIDIYLVSRDKDLDQLLTERVRLYDPAKDTCIHAADLIDLKGFTPQQAIDIQTLAGDTTDNVPGVQGVGVKTAAKLIAQYGTADEVVRHVDELTPKMRERVSAFAAQLPVTRELVTLRSDVPVSLDMDACAVDQLDFMAADPIFEDLAFNRLRDAIRDLAGADAPPPAQQAYEGLLPVVHDVASTYELINTTDKLDTLAKTLISQPRFALDTETTSLNPVAADLVGLSFCWQAGEACYVPVRGIGARPLPVDVVVQKLLPAFHDPNIEKIGHNLKYDITVLRQVGLTLDGPCFDTLIASFLLHPMRSSHSLDALARALLGHEMIPISELIGKGRNQITIDQVDMNAVCEYASEDADFTFRLYEQLAPEMSGSTFESLFVDTEMPLVHVLSTMAHHGIALDTKLLCALGETLGTRMEELTKQVHQAAEHSFNIDSPKQLATVLFDELGLPVIRKTKTGRSTDADTLHALTEQSDNPIPGIVLEYRELAKLKGTYVDTLPTMICKKTGRIHANFNQIGAITGRLSSSDPNLQNIPIRTETGRRIREAFVARDDDHVLLTADYSQIELRVLAHFCRDEALVAAFTEGQDIHRAVAAQVNGVSMDEVTSQQRSAAKAVNFGIIYGQSAFGLAKSLGIPVGEAKSFIDMYFLRYPGIRLFVDRCIDDAKRLGYAQTILGRRRPITELHSRNRQQVSFGERIAVNTVVQGSAADLIKRAMINIHNELLTGPYSARMLIQVHDELVFEIHRDRIDEETDMIRNKMEHAIDLDVPVLVDIAWGVNWAEGK